MTRERRDPMLHAPSDPLARREFMKRMAAAIAFASSAGCTRAPREEIVPYVTQPPEVTPGRPRMYASSFVLDGYATGLLVESHEGRPTKIEGNPQHPASLGASGVFEQASVLDLYDPNRMRGPARAREPRSAEEILDELLRGVPEDGRGTAVVLPPTSSPSVEAMLARLRARRPALRVFFHSAVSRANVWEGARLAFGRVVEPRYDLSRADVVVALDSDLLARGPASLRYARQLAGRRRVAGRDSEMSRLYVVEPVYTATGIAADHRVRVRAHDVVAIAAALLAEIGATELTGDVPRELAAAVEPRRAFVRALARDLAAHRGRSAIVAGDAQPAIVHALAHALNAKLGNIGSTVELAASPIVGAGEASHDPRALSSALIAREIDTLLVLGTNLVHTSPADRDMAPLVAKTRRSMYLGLYEDETARACAMTIPERHYLEAWGDARAFDGTVSIVQPVLEPMYGGLTALDVLARIAGDRAPAYDLVRASLRERLAGGADFERAWRDALKRGITREPASAALAVSVDWPAIGAALARVKLPAPDALEILFRADERVHDGRFANNAWLLELPSSVTKLTWTNAATMSPKTAARLGVADADEVELAYRGRRVRAPAHVVPGHADGTIGLSLGWGREGAEENARGRGVNAFALVTSDALSLGTGVEVHPTGARRDLPIAQRHHAQEGRDETIARRRTLAQYRSAPGEKRRTALPLYRHAPTAPRQWGMAIDLTLCIGCSACVVACQAENNVPTVGPEGVAKGRTMHWLRIDTYFDADAAEPDVVAQPMLCQHCEKAPCEYVCPVNATVHSEDGLNQMVYNRCVGTRFCSNNCPYKVRRFNWFDYHHGESKLAELVHNPDVTVRERGVMEKCTFCVQRIREHEIRERAGESPPPPMTACQQACPTGAIVFGDLLAKGSEVARGRANDRGYAALEELGTEPRVTYLERLKNENPEVA